MAENKPATFRDRPIFICGHPKAGTSLVRAILDSHPQLVVYPEETVFFRRYLPQAAGLNLEDRLSLAEKTLVHIFAWDLENPIPGQEGFPDRDYTTLPYSEVCQVMRQIAHQENRHDGDMLSAAILAFGQVSGQIDENTLYWVEKSPYNEYFTDQIFEWWPEARCIHVVRDPRDNHASYRRKHPDWRPEFLAANWNRSTQAGVLNQARYGDQRYRILRYEDLTQSPETHLQALADFLKITWDPSLSQPTRAGEQWAGNSMFSDQFQGISAAPVARWREELTPVDAAVIEEMTRPHLEKLGYPLDSPPSIAAHGRVFTWPIRRRFLRRRGRKPDPNAI